MPPLPPHLAALLGLCALLAVDSAVATLTTPASGPSATVVRAAGTPGVWMAHLLGCAGLLLLYQREHQRFARAPGAPLGLVMAALLGPLGALTAALALALGQWVPRAWALSVSDSTGVDAEQAALLREAALEPEALLEPRSLADVFRYGTLAERRSAVALIGANYRPAFAEALRMALHDEHNAIRVQAGMVMQTLEDAFDRRRVALEARLDAVLRSHGFGGEEVYKELGRLYDHQAYSGLLDEARSAEARDKALAAYRAYLDKVDGDIEATAAVGRLLVRAGRDDEAIALLAPRVAGGQTSVSVLMWLAEAQYRSRRYADLRRLVATHGEALDRGLPASSPLRATLELWQSAAQGGPADAR